MLFQEAVKALCFKMLQSWESRDEKQSRLISVRQYYHVLSSPSKINTFLIYCQRPFEKNATVTSAGKVHAACFYPGKKTVYSMWSTNLKMATGILWNTGYFIVKINYITALSFTLLAPIFWSYFQLSRKGIGLL